MIECENNGMVILLNSELLTSSCHFEFQAPEREASMCDSKW